MTITITRRHPTSAGDHRARRRRDRPDPHLRGDRLPHRPARPVLRPTPRPAAGPPAPPDAVLQRCRPRLPAADGGHPGGPGLARGRPRTGPGGPPRRDHRPHRPQDDDQRAEQRREGLAGGHGGRHQPHVDQRHRRAALAVRRHPRADRLHVAGGQGVHGRCGDPDHRVPAARLAPDREAPGVHGPRGPDLRGVREPRRRRPVPVPQRAGPHRLRPRAVPLPAQAGGSPGGAPLGRDLPVHRDVPGPAVRHHPRDGPHRDHHGRVRDGGDPLRAARPLRRPERRPLGLHLQRHQELPRSRTPVRPAGPRQRHDDRPVHEGVHRAARRHLPQAGRAGHRRHERVHPRPSRPGGHRQGAGAGQGGQAAGGRAGVRRHLGGAPRPRARRPRGVRRGPRRPDRPAAPAA